LGSNDEVGNTSIVFIETSNVNIKTWNIATSTNHRWNSLVAEIWFYIMSVVKINL
jgi:hypothetical protein